MEARTFYIVTNSGNVKLDSTNLYLLETKWIKSINVVTEESDSTSSAEDPKKASIFLGFKKKGIKKLSELGVLTDDDL